MDIFVSAGRQREQGARLLALVFSLILIGCGVNNTVPTARPTPRTSATPPPIRVFTATPAPTLAPTALPLDLTPAAARTECPLTGLALHGVALDERRPLLVKVGNSEPERPQSGLAAADIVFEHLTEGGITRFSAVYYCGDASEIGPIRSARLVDLELVPMFDAVFAHVGGSEPVRALIAASEIAKADLDDYGRSPLFHEIETRPRPYNRYSSTSEMWDLARANGWLPGSNLPGVFFSSVPAAGGRATARVTIPYAPGLSDVTWTYDVASGLYRRAIEGEPQLDAAAGEALTAANIVVLHAAHETTDIEEDSLGSRSLRITLTGSGQAELFRDGEQFAGTWTRTDGLGLPPLTSADGRALPLKPGQTWFQIVPTEMQIVAQ